MRSSLPILLAVSIAAGCAQQSQNVTATYVSPLQYQSLTCSQIGQEARRVSARAAQAAGVQDKNATGDAVATGVALVLFWPAAFFVRGGRETQAELARLKGEIEALEQANIQKGCGIEFRKA